MFTKEDYLNKVKENKELEKIEAQEEADRLKAYIATTFKDTIDRLVSDISKSIELGLEQRQCTVREVRATMRDNMIRNSYDGLKILNNLVIAELFEKYPFLEFKTKDWGPDYYTFTWKVM